MKKANRLYIAIHLLLLVGSIACGQLVAISESWVLQNTTIVDEGLFYKYYTCSVVREDAMPI